MIKELKEYIHYWRHERRPFGRELAFAAIVWFLFGVLPALAWLYHGAAWWLALGWLVVLVAIHLAGMEQLAYREHRRMYK